MNKKAVSVLMIIFELLAVAIISYTLVRTAHAYGSSLLTQKVNLAEDMKMTVYTLSGVPEDAVIKYPGNASSFIVILRQDSVSVFEKDDIQTARIERYFYLPKGYSAQGIVEEKENICLEKIRKKIILRECKDNDFK